ncbi:hypothetical protein phiPLPE_01 [Iodobacter phage PhiPLPE]|uniref:Helix-turn-helix domain-containing protein n=1 Tax=Iodobacter phage PhiPLPE TaxID=551895 RepID=B5AX20_9CAUD|nr:hypothetical protein phiPLPE_01 [Iodobacter phage PhiPLPE]ACG60323.1 hypothetical protein phiPLPE_01 [Iodobacter phage PhiPLPE]
MLVKEVAETLGVSEQWVRKLIGSGSIKAKRVGRDWSVSAASVRKYYLSKQAQKEV